MKLYNEIIWRFIVEIIQLAFYLKIALLNI